MASYGRNFEFRVPPVGGQRGGRYVLPADAAADLPIGVPVKVSDDPDANGLLPVELATGAQAPVKGQCGIIVYEADPGASGLAGFDPGLTTYSDIDKAPRGRAIQVVSGDMVKVVLRNTEDRLFLNARQYEGRTIFDESPAPAVGDFLTPGVGTDTDGYWAINATAANAWLIVESYDAARHEVEARLAF